MSECSHQSRVDPSVPLGGLSLSFHLLHPVPPKEVSRITLLPFCPPATSPAGPAAAAGRRVLTELLLVRSVNIYIYLV